MILKPWFYDKFHCTGDACTYTCCMDWGITLDHEETERHLFAFGERNEEPLILNSDGTSKLRFRENDGKCRFLDDRGLCRLVLTHGEEFICHTCHVFPRFETSYNDIRELHLSNACPEVLRFLYEGQERMYFVDDDGMPDGNVFEVSEDIVLLRERFIDFLQMSLPIPLPYRLFILQKLSGEYDRTKDAKKTASDLVDQRLIADLFKSVAFIRIPVEKTLNMHYQLVRDIGCYKKNLGAYRTYIKRIESKLSLLPNADKITVKKYDQYQKFMLENGYERFFENFSVNYIFTHAEYMFAEDQIDITIRTLLLEYVLIRSVLFLIWMEQDSSLSLSDVLNISAFYARMFEHGLHGTEGFVANNKDNPWFSDSGFLIMLK